LLARRSFFVRRSLNVGGSEGGRKGATKNMIKKFETLVYPMKRFEILLGYKKIGFGQGKWNGFGGKVEPGEECIDAARRELEEECGIKADVLELFGIIEFKFIKNLDELLVTYVYVCKDYQGYPKESNEMKPFWFPVDRTPMEEMWDDDQYWLPLLVNRKKFKAKFLFDENDKVIEKEVVEVENLE
jgi:8-oxo-dGTP diphosphatase / 2-hydroxy-dATP diphosphatase